ncbi:golgin subfamily A member 6-like protein 24 [Pseudochaenichthys georgianus]|uniref:golgin subfamily A member 6-like protein 24 n=1 Tax=Pseudochaenichthys georgianus TaxID=52239 RepID=UPI0039C0B42C
MAGIISPVVCEQEAAQRPEATHIFSRAKLEEVIKHWEFKYELLDKYAKDLAVKNKHWEVSWSYHQNMVITRIEQREAVIKGLTQSHQLLVQNNAGFVRAENGWQEVIDQKDSEIMDLKREKESLSHSASVSTNWQEKYNALKEESSKRLEKKKATNVESVEKDNKSLAERIRKDTAEKREGWASLSKLIKEKFQKIEDKKSHLEEMSTKLLAVKQEILEEEVKVENNGETVMVPEVRKMEDQIKNPEDKSIEDLAETLHSQAAEDTLMKEDQEEKFTEDESTQEVVQTPEVEDEQSTPEVVETPEMEDEQSTQEVVETPEMEDEQSTQEVVEIPEMEDEQSTQEVVEIPEMEHEKKEPEEFPDFPKTEAAEVELQTEESGEEIQLSLVAAVAIKDQSCETTEVEDEKKEPEEFFSLKKSGEVALQKEKRRKKKKQQRKRVKDIKLDGKFSEAQAEKQLSLDEELMEPQEESINDLVVETSNCWEINFTPMWKVKPTEDNLANKDHICDTPEEEEEEKEPEESPDLKQTEAGEAGLQEMESGEETKLSWAAVVANKYKSSKTRAKKVEELEEVSDLKQTEASEEMLQKEKNRNKKKHERRREKALKAMEIIVNEMDSLANIVQSCETSEATDEKKEVEEFPDLPKTEAGQESGEENKRSRAAVLKDQSCYTKEKKVEEEVKEPEEVSDPKKTEAQEEVLLKEEQVKDPEEASDPKQTPVEGKLRVGKKSKKDKKKEKKREEYNRSHC